MRMPAENVCKALQVLAAVDVVANPIQVPAIEKQPVAILIPFWAVEVAVEEAFNPPVRTKVPLIVEEALEIKPVTVDKPLTVKVPSVVILLLIVEAP